jgi:hypothetical protein
VKIRGRLRGNDGNFSGTVESTNGIDKISVLGGIFGGAGVGSGRVQAVAGAIDLAEIGGIFGAGGRLSGTIQTGKGLQELHVFGNIEGGNGEGSGGIQIGGLLGDGVIDGDILGGSAKTGASLLKSGYVIADRIQSLYVDGDLKAGQNDGTGLALSGTIRAETSISFLRIHGSVLGNEDTAAIISAAGKGNDRAAIKSLKIDGFARFAEILAGYGVNATTTNERGEAVNADARIGTVKFGGDVESISVIAGVAAGADGLFGTSDDAVLGGTDVAKSHSKIARILIAGEAREGTTSTGIVAQFVKSVSNVALDSGATNDLDRDEDTLGSNIHVFELPPA